MHIGFITPEYPSNSFSGKLGGIAMFTKNLALQLVEKKHKVSVFVFGAKEDFCVSEEGIKIHFIRQKRMKGFTWWTSRKYVNSYVNKVIEKEHMDVIEAPEWTGFTAFMKFKCPLVLRLHGSDTFFCHLENRKQKQKHFFFERRALKGADKIVAVSEYVKSKTAELFKIKNQIAVVHNTVDSDDFAPATGKIKAKTILYFGALIRKKGVLELASIFNKVITLDDGFHLTLIGKDVVDAKEGISTQQIFEKKLSKLAFSRVTFINHIPQQELLDYIHHSEIVVMPSFAEAFPLTWLESMSMQKKMVTSNIGWAKELMIDGETGFMVDPKDHETYAKRIIDIHKNDDEGKVMAANARKRIISNFNSEEILNKNIQLYKEIAGI